LSKIRLVRTVLLLLFLVTGIRASAQEDTASIKNDSLSNRFYLLQNVERGGEALPEIEIKEVTIYGLPTSSRRAAMRRMTRLENNIKRVYPYALIVRVKLEDVNRELEKISGDKERKKYIRDVEKNVFGDYEDDMRNMTLTQGRLLIKLIDRETQNTSYELIRQYRGGLSAAFWQGIARIFGTDLKAEYDPYGEDAIIEQIISDIEAGRI
jgi:hypothetical protein